MTFFLLAFMFCRLHFSPAAYALGAARKRSAERSIIGCGGDFAPGLSKLPAHAGAQSGSAAPTCGKPPAFRPTRQRSSFSAPAGRLSLPAGAVEVVRLGALRKGKAFPQVGRQSRSSWSTVTSVIWTGLTLRCHCRRETVVVVAT